MDIIGEKGMFDCIKSPEYIKELLLSCYASDQLKGAIETLESNCPCVKRAIRNVCLGAYIMLNEKEDELFHKLKEPIERTNRDIPRPEREQLIALLRRVDLEKVRLSIQFDRMSLSNEKANSTLSAPLTSNTDSTQSVASGTADSSTSNPESISLRASNYTEAPPRLYDHRGHLNEPYAQLLRGLGIDTWLILIDDEKPIEVWGERPEEDFKKMLYSDPVNEPFANRLLLFMRYKHSPGLKISMD